MKKSKAHPGFKAVQKCEYCESSFFPKKPLQRYCSNKCSIRANPKPQNEQKYFVTEDLVTEAINNVPYGKSKLAYIANKLGCSTATVSYQMKQNEWTFPKELRQKTVLTTTHVERKYVYEVGCVICKENRVMDAAHFVASRHGGYGTIDNIIPLCPTHHRLYDNGKLNEEELDKFIEFLFIKYPNLSQDFEDCRNGKITWV
jgi:hypothetical protein